MPFRSRPTGAAASARVVALFGVPERPGRASGAGGWTPAVPEAAGDTSPWGLSVERATGPAVRAVPCDDRGAWWAGALDPELQVPSVGDRFPDDLLWSPPPYDPAGGWPTAPRPHSATPGLQTLAAPVALPAAAAAPDHPPAAADPPARPAPVTSSEASAAVAVALGPASLVTMLRSGRVDPGRRGAIALALLGVVAAAIAAVVLLRARPSEQPLTVPPAAGTVSSRSGPQVVVDVAGRVRRPGLVHLPTGSRVYDALKAAGGVLPRASTAALNLARKVADGEQVLVPDTAVTGPGGGAVASGGGLLDLNLAAATDFDALPGIGPVLADRIVSWRTEHGGRFASVDQLREVSGIGESKYQSLKAKVRV